MIRETVECTAEQLRNEWWRLNHLYKIQDKDGNRITFRPRKEQIFVYRRMHFKNLI